MSYWRPFRTVVVRPIPPPLVVNGSWIAPATNRAEDAIRYGTCQRKARYTRREADRRVNTLWIRKSERVETYDCRFCGFVHLTSHPIKVE